MDDAQREVVAFLRDPASYRPGAGPALRQAAGVAEPQHNRRTAPQLYLARRALAH